MRCHSSIQTFVLALALSCVSKSNGNIVRYNGLVNTKAVGVSAAADNKGFVVTTKRAKLAHKPSKATLAVTMKAGLGRSLHKVKLRLANYGHAFTD